MNLRFVEAFAWSVSLKSITRAAQMMNITQSAMSSRIAALEQELGVVLLDRRDKQFRLTLMGERFHALAVEMLALQRRVRDEMGEGSSSSITLRIRAIESVVHGWLTEWLKTLQDAHPHFQLELTVESSPVLVEQVSRGAQDLIFTALPATDSGVRTRFLPSMPMSDGAAQVIDA
jgi:DNA-binding transcriptional LysR family regulator